MPIEPQVQAKMMPPSRWKDFGSFGFSRVSVGLGRAASHEAGRGRFPVHEEPLAGDKAGLPHHVMEGEGCDGQP